MNFYVFLKVFGDLCLYFACIGAFPALFPYDFSFLWPAIVCAASAGIAAFLSDHGRNKGRFPLIALIFCCLVLGDTVMEALILIPPVAYAIAMLVRDEWSLEYFHFREVFRKALILLGLFLLVIHFGSTLEDSISQRQPLLDSAPVLRYGLLYTVSGILLQRKLRMGSDSARDRYLNNIQLVLVTVGTGLFLLAIIFAERILESYGISLSELIGQALRFAVGLPIYLLGMLVTFLMGLDGKVLQQIQDSQAVETEPIETNPLPEMGEAILQQPQVEVAFPWWLAVLILAVLTLVLVYLTHVLRSRRTDAPVREVVSRILPKPNGKQPSRRSNRSKLRRVYREFLKSEKRKGHKLLPWHTSQDILETLQPSGDSKAAAVLRQLYLSARYDLTSAVTQDQVKAAKDALKQYRQE